MIALLTRCGYWLKQVSQQALTALMMVLMPLSFGLIAVNRHSAASSVNHSLFAVVPLQAEARVEELPTQTNDRRGKMMEWRNDRLRLGLSWDTTVPESGATLLPEMLSQMGSCFEWTYQTLLPWSDTFI